MENKQSKTTKQEYKTLMLKKLGLSEGDLLTKSTTSELSPKAKVKRIVDNVARQEIRTNSKIAKYGTMKYIFAIGLKNKKPIELNGEFFVIDNVVDANGNKGALVLDFKTYFENTFVIDYQELTTK